MLAKRDLGSRVVVRRRVGSRFTDLLGELTELSETHLTVATIRGKIRVPLDEVHRSKRVPDPAGLERAAAEAMPAPTVKRLGEWQLRAAEGFTGRANSVLPLGDPGLPFAEAMDEVIDFYQSQGLPPQVDVPLPLGRPVARALESLGWVPMVTVLVQVIDLPELIAATPPGSAFIIAAEPSEQMLSMIKGRRGGLPASAAHVLTAVPSVAFAGYQEKDVLLAMARGTVTRRWLGLTFVETAPEGRRRGLAREAIGAIARWAEPEGATRAFLQVQDDNSAALALYDSLGFQAHHRYTRYTRFG
ncbi:MAG TPA: GNAT family N-acetyltransferase [Micromonosporaceae bacterium]|nr:GNAT family N-acetyltransferase [Micromonosporaceae bacterium]